MLLGIGIQFRQRPSCNVRRRCSIAIKKGGNHPEVGRTSSRTWRLGVVSSGCDRLHWKRSSYGGGGGDQQRANVTMG
jgi:hypothetical protein